MNESEYGMSLNRPPAAEGQIECRKLQTMDIQIMPQNNFKHCDSLLNFISYITIPYIPHFMPRNTAVDVCDSRYSKAPEKSQLQLLCTLTFFGYYNVREGRNEKQSYED
jgi:hypothetical protein